MATESKQLSGQSGFKVRVVTPKGTAAQATTDAVTGPGRLGEFEVLPGHVPFLTELHPGVLVLGEKSKQYFAVGAGYLKVGSEGDIEVLVERAVAGSEVDIEAAKAELADVGPKVDSWSQSLGAEYKNLKDRRDWAQAQLDARRYAGN